MACPRITPPGFLPCGRHPDHNGPCAHPAQHPAVRYLQDALHHFDAGEYKSARAYVVSALAELSHG